MSGAANDKYANLNPRLLGPFVGHTTATTSRLWMHWEGGPELYVHRGVWERGKDVVWQKVAGSFQFVPESLWCATLDLSGLKPNTAYSYKITTDEEGRILVDLEGLCQDELYFRTLPEDGDPLNERIDFLIMSCHNPDKGGGYQVWEALPQVLQASSESRGQEDRRWVRFAILGGDQIYADDWEDRLLAIEKKEITQEEKIKSRQELYIEAYRQFWSHTSYRKVLCKMPAYLMWDDHDITDGWGSREDSFASKDPNDPSFLPEWNGLFDSAKLAFQFFQASRNPGLATSPGYDSCFRFGSAAFILADLRTHRNVRLKRIWSCAQFDAIKKWIADQAGIKTLFFLSPVVFSHEDPKFTGWLYSFWGNIVGYFHELDEAYKKPNLAFNIRLVLTWTFGLICTVLAIWSMKTYFGLPILLATWVLLGALSFQAPLRYPLLPKRWVRSFMESAGDLRDDMDDAWSSEANKHNAETVLHYFYNLQNQGGPQVVILSGDIHAGGYSCIHSRNIAHSEKPIIPHIVSSPVGYAPFNWIAEAIYRNKTRDVDLGTSGHFFAQISHHFTKRNVAVISVRAKEDRSILKVKYYVEGFPEPQISIFDLKNGAHLEAIQWKGK